MAEKHLGKSVDEVLGPLGLKAAKEGVGAVLAAFAAPPFTAVAVGEDFTLARSACIELKKKAMAAHESMVNLSIKVKKWKPAPPEMRDAIKLCRTPAAHRYF